MKQAVAIIMGARILPDGTPSNAVRRRVNGALQLREKFDRVVYLPSGAAGTYKEQTEAGIMASMLMEAGADKERIVLDTGAHNTLQSVVNCVQLIREHNIPGDVIVCSDRYHIPRSNLLLRMMGIQPVSQPMPSGLPANGLPRWIYYYCREAIAIPVDLALLTFFKISGKV